MSPPEIGKRYRYTKQPLSPAYEITHFNKEGTIAYGGYHKWDSKPIASIAFRKDMWPDLIPAQE